MLVGRDVSDAWRDTGISQKMAVEVRVESIFIRNLRNSEFFEWAQSTLTSVYLVALAIIKFQSYVYFSNFRHA